MEIDRNKISPMMKQYFEIKDKYKDCILFFRLGDFYEMFFDDAIVVSKMLELTLTGRDCGLEERAPMCGVPHHSADLYIKKLVDLGNKVAVCEQLTDPSETKGIVIRDVTRIITPGTITDGTMLDEGKNNYIASAFYSKITQKCGIAFADISTGSATLTVVHEPNLENLIINEFSRYQPAEVILNEELLELKSVMDFIKTRLNCSITNREISCFCSIENINNLKQIFNVEKLTEIDISENDIDSYAVSGLFEYINDTQKTSISRFTSIDIHNNNIYMGLDLNARRNLELIETLRNKEKRGSLLWVLDATKTSMGKRLLKTYIEQPLVSPAKICDRLDAVEALIRKSVLLIDITDTLDKMYDIERLMTKVMYKTATPRDLKSLSATSKQLPYLKESLDNFEKSKLISKYNKDISTLEVISSLVENAIAEDPPITLKDGGVIKTGFNGGLDTLRHTMTHGKEIIDNIEQRERELTGIKNLKIGFNRVFGYYIEITRSNYGLIPENYIRKQTLANCERFITEELKNAENSILNAKDKAIALEIDIFNEVRDYLAIQLKEVQKTAEAIANIDVLCSFATVSMKNQYIKPDISIDGSIDIKDGRHPVVELMLRDEMFVPNDTYVDTKSNKMLIITGPNMSGKSTYMRQVALITLMAQIGCYVPASYAKISIVDKIFTRVGASDDLTAGQSTFMVEMSEVSDILKNATPNSLIILDEVGRGTSTFDGVSIARAVAEHICTSKNLGCKTLFATHYHELIELENTIKGVKNYSIAVKKTGENIRFLRKIVSGGVDDSYGVDVARLAGLPNKVITRARALLNEMESKNISNESLNKTDYENDGQTSFMKVNRINAIDMLERTNIDELSDIECRELLEEMAKMIK